MTALRLIGFTVGLIAMLTGATLLDDALGERMPTALPVVTQP